MSNPIPIPSNPGSEANVNKAGRAISWVLGGLGLVGGLASYNVVKSNFITKFASKLKVDQIGAKAGIQANIISAGFEAIFILFVGGLGAWVASLGKYGRPIGYGIMGYALGLSLMWIINNILSMFA